MHSEGRNRGGTKNTKQIDKESSRHGGQRKKTSVDLLHDRSTFLFSHKAIGTHITCSLSRWSGGGGGGGARGHTSRARSRGGDVVADDKDGTFGAHFESELKQRSSYFSTTVLLLELGKKIWI
ncbi:unnamed protein product [Musa banksii]